MSVAVNEEIESKSTRVGKKPRCPVVVSLEYRNILRLENRKIFRSLWRGFRCALGKDKLGD